MTDSAATFAALRQTLESCADDPAVRELARQAGVLIPASGSAPARSRLLSLYRSLIDRVEPRLWSDGTAPAAAALESYQRLFREMETLIATDGSDDSRHDIVVVIPVADRPEQLRDGLLSLLEQCRIFGYGGMRDGRFAKVSALIADDSREARNIHRHRELAASLEREGLTTRYFGPQEQQAELAALDAQTRARLQPILGASDPDAFHHKGASVTRNLAYLYLARLANHRENRKLLFHFVDSDQSFQVAVADGAGDRSLYAVNHFYWLDRIFSETEAWVVTGKVVGDPPVSPAVMAGNFMDDVIACLERMAGLDPAGACAFHGAAGPRADDAAYHDMADLFGFASPRDAFPYRCELAGRHDNAACLRALAARLDGFFDGEHPTRRTTYGYRPMFDSLVPARTVYTGNYVLNRQGLRWFIPFAPLKLRMAGPALGRLIRAEAGERFFTANLPLLHRRTIERTGQAEFRTGIDRTDRKVALSGEFERQFFGDLMLFGLERLTDAGFPAKPPAPEQVQDALRWTEQDLLQRYRGKHLHNKERLGRLASVFEAETAWWNRDPGMEAARCAIGDFIRNMTHNFGADASGYALADSDDHRQARARQMRDAIMAYGQARDHWENLLGIGSL